MPSITTPLVRPGRPSSPPLLRTCCCGVFSLRMGTVLIAASSLLFSIISLLYLSNILRLPPTFTPPPSSPTNPPSPTPPPGLPIPLPVLTAQDLTLTLTTLAMSALGLHAALTNNVRRVKVYAWYTAVKVGYTAVLAVYALVVASRECVDRDMTAGYDVDVGDDGKGDTPTARVSCATLIWAMSTGLLISTAWSVYFAVCVWSYYVDLRSNPLEYHGVDGYVAVAGDVGGGEVVEEESGSGSGSEGTAAEDLEAAAGAGKRVGRG
ncbi:uncharacterized protein EV422DRAFT_540067 [Fimicolochytrium jonesii]|uniref:uncharacterized protein n=1 Tax=Fimicolochytrium jonesii TaxID=1396493 RepID=UPI0022FED4AD|nr:uncharacterized protein EV422DRAFT_540067 [Fimicolochytrium jonesii]KAI8817818.1 hypothetical protein EV422DRAFT_540067 [Fimicolochytrium jonesii]